LSCVLPLPEKVASRSRAVAGERSVTFQGTSQGKPIQSKSELTVLSRSFRYKFCLLREVFSPEKVWGRTGKQTENISELDLHTTFRQDYEVHSSIAANLHRARLNCGKAIC